MPVNPAIPLLEIILQTWTHMCKATYSKMLIAALFTVTRNWKQPEFPSWRLIEVWHGLEWILCSYQTRQPPAEFQNLHGFNFKWKGKGRTVYSVYYIFIGHPMARNISSQKHHKKTDNRCPFWPGERGRKEACHWWLLFYTVKFYTRSLFHNKF